MSSASPSPGASPKPKMRHSIAVPDDAMRSTSRSRSSSFLHLHMPDHHLGSWSTHLHLPTFSITTPEGDSAKRFHFGLGLRRHSHTTLHRSESMVSLCYRSLVNFVNEDNLPGLQAFLENKQIQVDDRDENGTTPLMVAATKGRNAIVRELLSHGADANAEDADGWTALLCAAKEGFSDICDELLEHGAEIEHREMGGWTALVWATYKDRIEVLRILLDRQADVNAHGNYHISSLLWAAGRGYTEIAKALIQQGAKVNVGDKYGTTALVWACRKGHTEIVDSLLKAGANVDTAGMYSWTALLVATQGNHVEVVNRLLEHKPNVNALDKDGCTALTIACKEGYYEIACALLNVGAYINIQDRAGDTNLIHAVKGGHRAVVEALLKKYADVDICGKDRKTAMYNAVEKGNVAIVKLLLNANPDLEISTKDGDTPLLKAVRSRNAELVSLLLDKKSKVTATDKKGDTSLHVAMRARSKGIVEILLRNPKNSQLLYRPNRAGETPYNIDMNHQKTILGQIFGARRLNTNEDNENMLGYDLYSSALADILSEPSLSMPITVGLYAKWGSGKSFLLNKLREEMKNFAREWVDPVFQFSSLLFIVVIHIALIIGLIVGLVVPSWILGLCVGLAVLIFTYLFLTLVWFASQRYDWDWPYNFNIKLTRNINSLRLILQVMFCHPPGTSSHENLAAQPIKFYFTDQTRVSTTTGGENSVVQMIGSLYDAIESDYGALSTRLYRAFKPKAAKSSSSWRWRKLCCLPYVLLFEIMFLCLLVGICALTVFLVNYGDDSKPDSIERITLQVVLATAALLLGITALANMYTWSKMFRSLLFSQRRHLQRTIAKLDTLKSEGFLQALKHEVNLMKDMVRCLDSLCCQQRRLVIILDGLDSCEQDKVLLVLDAVHMLFSDANCPFIVILAIDPHVIAKAVEVSSRRLFSDTNIGGHDYLRNMVHLPFYLQNSGLRKLKIAQQTAQAHRKVNTSWADTDDSLNIAGSSVLARSLSNRRLSSESALMSSSEKLKLPPRKGSRKLKLSESVASSIGSNLNRIGGAQDLTKMLLTDDYFSDVNPRSMRRLMNVVYVTGRLLKSFQIDFNWYHLASWINITEQWPFRTSWIILHHEIYEDNLDDNTSLKNIYDKVRPHIPTLKDIEPLLELDRDERKFDIFLTFHRSSLLVSDLKIFLPFTINLDPYLKKVIKEETQSLEDDGFTMGLTVNRNPLNTPLTPAATNWSPLHTDWITGQKVGMTRRQQQRLITRNVPNPQNMMYPQTPSGVRWPHQWGDPLVTPMTPGHYGTPYGLAPVTPLPPEVMDTRLSTLNVEGVCQLLRKIDDLNPNTCQKYINVVKDNNVNGRVLLHCDMDELKAVLKMSFGDWEMFRVLIVSLRELELTLVCRQDEAKNVRFHVPPHQQKPNSVIAGNERKGSGPKVGAQVDKDKVDSGSAPNRGTNKHSVMEKQVTLEEQMICGALQTLNEEACEDVEAEHAQEMPEPIVIIPASPDVVQDGNREMRSRTNSSCGIGETDYVILQSSPIHHLHWQPISISGQGEGQSEHSSQCSTPAAISPVFEKRKASNLKANSQFDNDEKNSRKAAKHVVIKTEYFATEEEKQNLESSDMKALFDNMKYSIKTPLIKPVSAENLSDNKQKKCNRSRPSSLHIFRDNSPVTKEPPTQTKSKVPDSNLKNPVENCKEKVKETCNVDKSTMRKDKLSEMSDDESTPLVSDMSSTPSAGSSQYVTGFSHNSSKSEQISSPSSIGSITSQSSISPDSKCVTTEAVKSNQNLNESTALPDNLNGIKTHSFVNVQSALASPESKPPRRRTMSDVSMSKIIDPVTQIYKYVTVSSSSLASKASSMTGHGNTLSLSSSGHLSRQDALDSDEENMKYLFCNTESGV